MVPAAVPTTTPEQARTGAGCKRFGGSPGPLTGNLTAVIIHAILGGFCLWAPAGDQRLMGATRNSRASMAVFRCGTMPRIPCCAEIEGSCWWHPSRRTVQRHRPYAL